MNLRKKKEESQQIKIVWKKRQDELIKKKENQQLIEKYNEHLITTLKFKLTPIAKRYNLNLVLCINDINTTLYVKYFFLPRKNKNIINDLLYKIAFDFPKIANILRSTDSYNKFIYDIKLRCKYISRIIPKNHNSTKTGEVKVRLNTKTKYFE